jgi:hypothetical protein
MFSLQHWLLEKDRLLIKGIKEVRAQFAEQAKVDRLIGIGLGKK